MEVGPEVRGDSSNNNKYIWTRLLLRVERPEKRFRFMPEQQQTVLIV